MTCSNILTYCSRRSNETYFTSGAVIMEICIAVLYLWPIVKGANSIQTVCNKASQILSDYSQN